MTLFLWKKSYHIGVPEVDAQHRRLVGMINELSDAMMDRHGQRTVPHILAELSDYIQLHFETEESYMQENRYPGIHQHKQMHIDLTKKVVDFREKARQGQEVKAKELLDFLCSWLKNHIMVEDKEFGAFILKR
jgi:hemerythrin-like metal-binding protein